MDRRFNCKKWVTSTSPIQQSYGPHVLWEYPICTQQSYPCSQSRNKPYISHCEWIGLKKGGTYIAKDCAHLKNTKLCVQRGPNSILAQLNKLVNEGIEKWFNWRFYFKSCPWLSNVGIWNIVQFILWHCIYFQRWWIMVLLWAITIRPWENSYKVGH
jgi:hypothetical protein